ncbi:MAG: flagellar export protein FliJ [Candidatus Hydrogenedentes bacterium]|nr:flagellar export protein FliJ [Candidatus Hydrogenedentota bacterium]
MPRRDPERFDTLLRVRKRQEQLRAQSLAEVRTQIRSVQRQRQQISEEQVRMIHEASEAVGEQLAGPEIHMFFQYERHLARLVVERDATLRRLRTVEEERRSALEDSMKRRRVVERLQERYQQEAATEQRKMEQKLNDEIAGVRASRHTQGEREP